jgi:fumarylpyruvate hydrolase
MTYVFSPPLQAAAYIAGSDVLFPVHRIYCVGQNYAEHAIEMGGSGRDAPFFFMKPADAVLPVRQGETGAMPYPPMTANLHHEVELVAAIGKGGSKIPAAQAMQHVWGFAVGLDMTRRDLQAESKKQGRPWSTAKGFDCSAPVAPICPVQQLGDLAKADIYLRVDGVERQRSSTAQMIWNVAEIIEHLSRYYTLQPGDLIFTGTPAGVGPVQPGNLIEAGIDGLGELKVAVLASSS